MNLTRTLFKQFYVTTPIFYVNAAPHVGHLYSMVLADTVKRWHKLVDPESGAFMSTGTDEHGMKVQSAALAAHEEPKAFVDRASATFQSLANQAKLSHDRFIRTTDKDHSSSAQALWQRLHDNGYIYKGQHSGWYSVSDETFYPESQLHKNDEGKLVSMETGKPVEWFEEDNYFFALSKIQPQLLEFLQSNNKFVVPEDKYRFIVNEVERGLTDLSISRPFNRCSWGIPVPNDPNQVMYVWLEALANYLTCSGYPDSTKINQIWPADAHIVGKDIQRFHAIYWPAFLLAAGLKPPKQVVVHSHWTIAGSKMSKSLGNVADPVEAMDTFGVEPVKFFLLYDGYLDHDSPYSSDRIVARHNTELVNRYGNLVMRVCGPKFNITRAVAKETDAGNTISERVDMLTSTVNDHMNRFDTPRALEHIWSLISDTNLYIQTKEPWKLDTEAQDQVIKDSAEVARVSSILLTAFIPEIAHKVLDRLSVDHQRRTIDYAGYGKDATYGVGANVKGNVPLRPL